MGNKKKTKRKSFATTPRLSFDHLMTAPSFAQTSTERPSDHCDDYIEDPTAPSTLRKFLAFARAPAHGLLTPKPHPVLFADHEGKRVRITMASRFGDVGITADLRAELGYEHRVSVNQLTNFSEEP
jgi:hypothetical protein